MPEPGEKVYTLLDGRVLEWSFVQEKVYEWTYQVLWKLAGGGGLEFYIQPGLCFSSPQEAQYYYLRILQRKEAKAEKKLAKVREKISRIKSSMEEGT